MTDQNHAAVLVRLRVELYTAAQLFKGENLEGLKQLVVEISQVLDVEVRLTEKLNSQGCTCRPGVAGHLGCQVHR